MDIIILSILAIGGIAAFMLFFAVFLIMLRPNDNIIIGIIAAMITGIVISISVSVLVDYTIEYERNKIELNVEMKE